MKWNEIITNIETKEIKVPDDWLHIHYYEALNILFRFENFLRVFVYIILKENLKEKWDETNIKDNKTIKSISNQRKNQDEDYGYLTCEINSPMLYLSSGELIDIIMHDKNWKYFNRYFKAKKEIIKHKLLEIGAIRNALAHFRPINEQDLDVIKQNVKHTLLLVEKTLNDITNITIDVPTNTKAIWYKNIKDIISENFCLFLYQDIEQNWIKIQINLNIKKLHTSYEFDTLMCCDVTNIKTTNILKESPILRNNVIFVEESVIDYLDNQPKKKINLVFSKNLLLNNWDVILKELLIIFNYIDKDVELLSNDNIAEAILLNKKTIYYKKNEASDKYWNLDKRPLFENIEDYNGVEYWGENEYCTGNSFIVSEHKLPWMPVSISSNKIPF
ncbi:hypothetical protein [Poseidonibacter lekithochrous]|uniref:hypothetical protein n=1 Tax=Poseidonibacter lekithochrous TaxID=1904463 RepID=UPI0008FC581D|nr:hypothetical protein [Poseidonibacter lekithochrous]QKJ22984.1 hypothetical protein ALEK_1716 [Poseidonibacter lekithochrous]